MFASMLGMVLALVVLFFIFIGIISVMVTSLDKDKTIKISSGSILEIRLDEPVKERTPSSPFKNFDFVSFESHKQLGLYDIIKNIDKAVKDENIKGIYLNLSSIQSRNATIEEIRNALTRFKKSKKFIIAYAEYYTQNTYYLVSVADKIYLHPEGAVEFKGYFTELMFFKGMFSKLEIEPEVIKHGKFKSAVEPFISDKMSNENRAQIKEFVDDLWNHTVNGIAKARNKSVDELNNIADNFSVQNSNDAVKYGLVDQLYYDDEVISELKKKTGTATTAKLKLVSINKYNRVRLKSDGFVKEKIAVIFASGTIDSGEGDEESIGSETTAKAIRKAYQDKNIKAIVFRVNSPGGSALASDVIWREVSLAQKTKPVVVSMGDLAASGGYYISCVADTIVAQPNTITGSIGVFGLLFNIKSLLNNKFGITTDIYKTGKFSDLGMPTHPLSDAERQIIQNSVEKVYDTFTKHVAEGRNIEQSYVDSIGQGRVWSGEDAKRLGLVDVLGNFDDAITIAAKMAKIDKYRITELPEQKDPIEEIISEMSEGTSNYFMNKNLGQGAKYFRHIKEMLKINGVQMRLPFEVAVN